VRRSLALALEELARAESETEVLDRVGVVFRNLLDQELTAGVQSLQQLQSEGLKAVFPDQEISVRSEVEVLRGKVSVTLVTSQRNLNGELVEGEALEGFGGAVSTVQSVLLRLALIFRRGLRPLMVLDETLPAFDDKYVVNMGSFLKTLCRRMAVDILLITHNQELVEAADRAYRIHREKDGSVFRRLV
jgi:ABC-type dipeptide/oligopeptide/nickel transport system ATPase subunit